MASREQRRAGGSDELEVALARSPGRQTRVVSRYGAGNTAATPSTGITIDDVATVAVDGKGSGRAMDRGVTDRVGAHLGVVLSSQKDPITSVPEQEFIAHSWKVLDTSAPALSPDDQKAAMKKALSYWPKMPPDRQTANAARKKQIDDWIAAHP